MQNTNTPPAHARELNTLAWVIFAGALIALTVLFAYVQNRQQIQKLMSQARASKTS
jgi:hypothetical protein